MPASQKSTPKSTNGGVRGRHTNADKRAFQNLPPPGRVEQRRGTTLARPDPVVKVSTRLELVNWSKDGQDYALYRPGKGRRKSDIVFSKPRPEATRAIAGDGNQLVIRAIESKPEPTILAVLVFPTNEYHLEVSVYEETYSIEVVRRKKDKKPEVFDSHTFKLLTSNRGSAARAKNCWNYLTKLLMSMESTVLRTSTHRLSCKCESPEEIRRAVEG